MAQISGRHHPVGTLIANPAPGAAVPEMKQVKATSETNGALANHIDSYFMDATSFSALK